jgi:glycosyltransferase involved in cell wall biosynthesis
MAPANRRAGLSVLLVTYNQQKHVRQALDSLFAQRIDGPIELIVADDGSTDATLSMIETFDGGDRRFTFTYLDHTRNRGITRNYQRGFAACHGDYVAVLEGDDYWVSPSKLQRQRDFLDAHWECDLCSVNYFVYEEERAQFTPRSPIGSAHRFLGARELIGDNLVGNFSTCMYRRSALERLPAGLFDIDSYDWIVSICVARHSLIGFLEEPMSVYRLHPGGAWTQKPLLAKLQAQLDLIPAYDELTDRVFHSEFEALAGRLRQLIGSSRVEKAIGTVTQPVGRALPTLLEYSPPVLLAIVQAIVPPKLKRFLGRLLLRRAT